MPIVQIDWQSIKSLFTGDTAILPVTYRQAQLLLSLSEQLSWEKTFRDWNYDFSDWDELQAEIDDLRKNLIMPADIGQIIELIDEVEDLLRAIDQHAGCCGQYDAGDGTAQTDAVQDGVGDVPPNVVSAGYAASSADWSGFDDYKCMISHVVVDDMANKLRTLAPHVDSAGAIVGGIGAVIAVLVGILTGTATALVVGILAGAASVAAVYENLTSGSFLENLADEIDANHDDLACAIYEADGSDAAGTALFAKIDELWTDVEALILKSLNQRAVIRALYSGRYDEQNVAQRLADQGFDVGDYDCSCVVTYDVDIERDFGGGQYGWTPNARAGFQSVNGCCNSQTCWALFANSTTVARIEKNLFAWYVTDLGQTWPVGQQFYVQLIEFDWLACTPGSCNQDPDLVMTVSTPPSNLTQPTGFNPQVSGTYTTIFETPIQLTQASEVGIQAPTQPAPTGTCDTSGFVLRYRIAGYFA